MAASLQARKQQLVREAIWDAAMDLFAEKGFDETTVDDIAQAAGVSRRSFFRYFSSKNDLMAYAMLTYGNDLIHAIDACPPADPLFEVFRKTVFQVARTAAGQPRARKIMGIGAKYPAARAAELSRLAEVQELVAEAYARRARKKSKDDVTPGILAALTVQVVGVALNSWFKNGGQDVAGSVDSVFKVLSRLLCDNAKTNR